MLLETIIRNAVRGAINDVLSEAKEQRALQTNIFGGVDDETEKNKAAAKKKAQAKKRQEAAKERKAKRDAEKKRAEFIKDQERMPNKQDLFGNKLP